MVTVGERPQAVIGPRLRYNGLMRRKLFSNLALAVSIVAAAGCGFSGQGQEEAKEEPPIVDSDGDGHFDSVDNCPTVANPDQKNSDTDGRGDACDNCLLAANDDQKNSDTDALGDACDNCLLVANPPQDTMTSTGMALVQRDHDGDGRGDVCDLCPHLASAAQDEDTDGDGIGAPCDPDPAVKNPPAEFWGFYEMPAITDWNVPTAAAGARADWEIAATDGTRLWLKQKNAALGWYQLHRLKEVQRPWVDAVVRVEAVAPANGSDDLRSSGVIVSYNQNGGTHNYGGCAVRRDVNNINNDVLLAAMYDDENLRNGESRGTAWAGGLLARDTHLLGNAVLVGANDSNQICRGTAAGTAMTTTNIGSVLRPSGQVGVRTYGSVALFDYVFLVDNVAAPAATEAP